jgi:hypothetical protein
MRTYIKVDAFGAAKGVLTKYTRLLLILTPYNAFEKSEQIKKHISIMFVRFKTFILRTLGLKKRRKQKGES